MTICWPLSRTQVSDLNGAPILSARVRFYESDTTTPLAVFKNPARTVEWDQPIACDNQGRFPRVYLPDGLYAERMFTDAGDLWFDDRLGEPLPVDVPEDPEPEIDLRGVLGTGDVLWRMDNAVRPGWIRLNDRSVGDVGSGATERDHADTKDLFVYLWQTFPDRIARVPGGRGGSAVSDFNAGKTIVPPTMQGLMQAGLDTMGSSAARTLQTIGNLQLQAGSEDATVAASVLDRIAIGMRIFADGVPSGTAILAIDGTAITMSNPAQAGSTGTVSARFAEFDVEEPGAAGGNMLQVVRAPNLPVNMPDGKVIYDAPGDPETVYGALTTIAIGDGGAVYTVEEVWTGTASAGSNPAPEELDATIQNPKGGVPMAIVPPCRVGTFYMKL